MDELLEAIENRLGAALSRLAAGGDLPPGHRYRLEGLLEAAVLTGAATEAELAALLRRLFEVHFRRPVEDSLWAGWKDLHPFPALPLYMARAPVSPSTSD